MAATSSCRALVVHPGSLGDVLLARPAIHAIRHADPTLDVILLASREVGGLLRDAGEVQDLWPLEDNVLAGLLSGSVSARDPWPSVIEQCAIAVCWLSDRDGRLRATLERLGVGVVIVESPHAQPSRVAHQSDRFVQTIQALPAGVAHCGTLRLPPALVQEGRDRLSRLPGMAGGPAVVLHPGGGSRHKCCPPARMAELADGLSACGMVPVLVSGPADQAIVSGMRPLLRAAMPIVDGISLGSLAGLLAAADVYVGHDSGVTHLAAALGSPTVALFGPTEALRWAPRGRLVHILSGEPCRCHGWDEVRRCPEKPCLNIAVEDVVAACRHLAQRTLGGTGAAPASGPSLEVPTRLC